MMVKIMVVFFDLVFGLGGGYYFFHNLALYLKYGNSRLRFGGFPFYLGDKLSVILVGLPSEINRLQLDLRFIEEKYETRYRGRKKESVVVCYQLYHEARTLKGSEALLSDKFSLEWDLPGESEFTSTLSERSARFWKLEVKADTLGEMIKGLMRETLISPFSIKPTLLVGGEITLPARTAHRW